MPFTLVTIPCLSDNYAYLIHDGETGATAVVDVPEAKPIISELKSHGWTLSDVILTHHHDDHIQGVAELIAAHPARVIGASADTHRLPSLDVAVKEGDTITIGRETGTVIDVSGHTIGHIAIHFPDSQLAFTADSLMALGCGRVFEGTFEQMFDSLSKLAVLPPDTVICSGHEYTLANGRFAMTIEPDNAALQQRIARDAEARAANRPTVPTRLSDELATNPFLRAHSPEIRQRLNMETADAAQVFAEIRRRKDRF